jgi:hypothetical protein
VLPDLVGKLDPALTSAFDAIATARVGQAVDTSTDNRMQQFSINAHVDALRKLRTALQNPTRMHKIETLVSTMVLALFEVSRSIKLEAP